MKILSTVIVIIILLNFNNYIRCGFLDSDFDQLQYIQQLYQLAQDKQCQKSQDFSFLPPRLSKLKGLYESQIKLNVLDQKNELSTDLLRQIIGIYDNNMFVTNFILYAYIEAYELGTIKLDSSSFQEAIDALLNFLDKNQPENSPIYTFWPQVEENNEYVCRPENMVQLINAFEKVPFGLDLIAVSLLVPKSQQLQWISFLPFISSFKTEFQLPPDTDDTSLNLMLGSLLRNNKNDSFFTEFFNQWEQNNNNYQYYFNLLKKFAYRPFNSMNADPSQNPPDCDQIDPRTYFALHQFLDDIYEQSQSENLTPNLVLPTTWILNLEAEKYPDIAMPLNVNNVDLSVNSNILFGITHFLLSLEKSEADAYFDEEIRQIYVNATSLIRWGVATNRVIDFPNLCLLYYPSIADFFWFIARTLNVLESYKNLNTELPYLELEFTRKTFRQIFQDNITQIILETSTVNSNNQAYWDGFLGNYANTDRGNDRVFTTAVMINALIDGWTIKIPNSKTPNKKTLVWLQNTPDSVKNIVSQGIQFLQNNVIGNYMQLDNAFFSGSGKLLTSTTFLFPANLDYDLLTNKTLDPHAKFQNVSSLPLSGVEVMKGYVNHTEYEHMLNDELWAGYHAVDFFEGYDDYKLALYPFGFPFWSSDSITYALSMLAVTKDFSLQ